MDELFICRQSVTDSTNGLTDGRTDGRVWSLRKTAFYFEKKLKLTNLQNVNISDLLLATVSGHSLWQRHVQCTWTPLCQKSDHSCSYTLQVTFRSAANMTLLFGEQSAVRYRHVSTQLHDTLQHCCGSSFAALLHTVAVRDTSSPQSVLILHIATAVRPTVSF